MGTSDRRPYLSASVLNQSLLNECQDNLTNRLEMVAEIENVGDPSRTIYVSDRHKYIDGTFYEARVQFPVIERTIGDWLSGELEFSGLTLTVNNADKYFNELLPGGSSYNGFVGKRVTVKIGLGEIGSTYTTVFSGEVTNVGGFGRDVASFTLECRNDFDKVNVSIPNQALIENDFPDIEDEFIGLSVPIIYGDWTVNLRPEAPEIPMFPVNGKDPLVNASLEPPDPNVGDTPLRVVISSTPIDYIDTVSVYLRRGDNYYVFDSSDITPVLGTDNQIIDITQKNLLIDGNPWIYETGDEFYCAVKGVYLGATINDNIVYQGKDILKRFGGLNDLNFHSSYNTIANKIAPAESAIASIKSRVWLQESNKCLAYVLSMFEQVRLETFVNRTNLFELSTLHFEDFQASPSHTIKNWDVVKGTFRPQTDERNFFNRSKADYCYSPPIDQAKFSTGLYRNQNSINLSNREISKLISFPNLYIGTDVENQLIEMIKLASSNYENIELSLTSRAFLLDISDDVILDVSIGSIDLSNVTEPITAKIRLLSYNPIGLSISAKLWSFQMIPFPGSLKSGISGITGGSTAIITKEI